MSYNQEIYDRVVQHLADTRLYEAETQGNASKAIHRHRLRLADLLARDIKADVKPEIQRAATSARVYNYISPATHYMSVLVLMNLLAGGLKKRGRCSYRPLRW